DDPAPAGESGKQATIPYIRGSAVMYEYDESSGVYLRTMAGKAHTDKNSDVRLPAATITVAEAKHRIVDDVGRREVDVKGPGKGILLQSGVARDVTWRLAEGVIRVFEDEAATREIPLLPGKTWVQIVPDAGKVALQ